MTVDETAGSAVTVLLSTSEEAFSKSAGYQLTSYEKEEGVDGPFAVEPLHRLLNEGQDRLVLLGGLPGRCTTPSSGSNRIWP